MTKKRDNKIVELVPQATALVPVFNEPIKFNVTDAAIAKLRAEHKVKPVTNTKELEENVASIAVIRTIRVNVDKKRIKLKEDAKEYGKKVQKEANRITAELESIEQPLKDAKDKYKAERAAIAEEKKRKEELRIQTIKDKINEIKVYPANFVHSTIPQIKKAIELLLFVKDEFDYQEFASEVLQVKTTAIDGLKQLQTNREKLDREAKEAEEKRIELEKQEAELKKERKKLALERAKAKDEKAEAARLNKIENDKLVVARKEIENAQVAIRVQKTLADELTARRTIKKPAIEHTQKITAQFKEWLYDAAPLMLATLEQVLNNIESNERLPISEIKEAIRQAKEGRES